MGLYYSLSSILDGLGPEPMWHMTKFGRYDRDTVWYTLVNAERIRQVLEPLTKKEAQALLQFMIQNNNVNIHNPSVALQRYNKMLDHLSRNLVLFTSGDGYTKTVVPFDFYPPIIDALLIDRPQSLASTVRTPRDPAGNGFEAILPLFHLLSQARKEPLPMTNQGQVYRRSLNKVKKLLSDDVSYDSLEAFAHVAYYHHLLQRGKGHTLEASLDIENFLSRGVGEILSRILQYALQHGLPFQVITLTMATLLEPDQWLDLPNLVQWAKNHRIPAAYDAYSLSYYLTNMADLGIWESRDRNLWRLTSPYYYGWIKGQLEALSEKTLIIEPTGDVLAPPDTALSILWDIDGMAEIKKYDQMRVYHISRHSITTAVLDGWDAEMYVHRLENMARVPVPSNLKHNIYDWFRQLSRHHLIRATVLHSAVAEDSSQAERILGRRVIQRLSPTDLIVDHNDVKTLVRTLEKSGIPVIPVVNEFDADHSKKSDTRSPQVLDDYDDDLGGEASRRLTVQRGNPLGLSRKIRPLIGTQDTLVVRFRPANKSQVESIVLRPITIDPIALNGVTHENKVITVYLDQIESYEVNRT